MARLTIKEAVVIAPVSESTLRRDIKSGKVSSEKDDRGRRRIDTAELARAYGQLTQSTQSNDTEMNAVDTPNSDTVNVNDTPDTHIENPKIVALLENQIADLKAELERATDRENVLITEKTKLLDMLSTEQEKTRLEQEKSRLLMLPGNLRKESENSQLAAPACWCKIATCLNFAYLIYSLNQFGWHCYETEPTPFLPPFHRSKWIIDWRLEKTVKLEILREIG